jgi:hypothetical protein
VLKLHKVVKHRDVGWFVLVVECVTLHNVCVIVPLLVLTKQLAALHAACYSIRTLVAVAGVYIGNSCAKTNVGAPVRVRVIGDICRD